MDDEEGTLVDFLTELTKRAYNVNPMYPAPMVPGDGLEVHLMQHSDSGGEEEDAGGGVPSLDFEDDEEQPLDLIALAEGSDDGTGA